MANEKANVKETEVKMVEVFIPKTRPDEEDEFVSVNDRTYIVKKGERVAVPEWVAEVLEHKQRMLMEAYAKISALNKGEK